ncbi:hypothetical protein UMC2_08421 [[Clostridium] sordellii]|uniref:hypothetical protein n=1 Tax=Paraclostridium sordellii TaxID=1505 RepID=UPI0005439827|nr:hypothetical protein [Paeniclostridium sordellii]CEK33592.1 hypothetical protein UMC2_08421 [[Clostridium] sordellii] [Paeniclostridium sordellii]
MANTNVEIINEVTNGRKGEWSLYFQYCKYNYADGKTQKGYRFIWRTPEGKLQAARGQARIPSVAEILNLTSQAMEAGWGNHRDETCGHAYDQE